MADTLDAMTSDRPYRMRTSMANAMFEIQRCCHTQFDPEVVRAFLEIGEQGLERIRKQLDAAADGGASVESFLSRHLPSWPREAEDPFIRIARSQRRALASQLQ